MLTEMLGGSMMLIQIEPSFSSGKNSVPRFGTTATGRCSTAPADA
jgi:hypothetical protein